MSTYDESISVFKEDEDVTVAFSFHQVAPVPSSSSSRHIGDLHHTLVSLLGIENVMNPSISTSIKLSIYLPRASLFVDTTRSVQCD